MKIDAAHLLADPATAKHQAHAVVIGSGFGGLAAAIRLGARGYRVTILEKLDAPGGRAYVHRQDGFTFDAGPTIVTAPFLLEELWAMCGRKFAEEMVETFPDAQLAVVQDAGLFSHEERPAEVARALLPVLAGTP